MLYPSLQFASNQMEILPNIERFEVGMQNNIVNTQICMHGKYYEKGNTQGFKWF